MDVLLQLNTYSSKYMSKWNHTVCGQIQHQLALKVSQDLHCFSHPHPCRILSISSTIDTKAALQGPTYYCVLYSPTSLYTNIYIIYIYICCVEQVALLTHRELASSACNTTFNAAGPEQLFYQRRRKGSSRASRSMPTSWTFACLKPVWPLLWKVDWRLDRNFETQASHSKSSSSKSNSQIRNNSTHWDCSSSGRWLLKHI